MHLQDKKMYHHDNNSELQCKQMQKKETLVKQGFYFLFGLQEAWVWNQ